MTESSELQSGFHSDVLKGTVPFAELLSRLTDTDPFVRVWAAIGLRRLCDPRAIPFLFARVEDPDWDVRAEVINALKVLIAPDDVPNLFGLACIPKANPRDDPSFVAMHAYRLLRKQWMSAIDFLANSLASSDVAVREHICTNLNDHLYFLEPSSAFEVGDAERINFPANASEIIQERLLRILLNGLSDVSLHVRVACVTALKCGYFHIDTAYAELLPLLRDRDAPVREAAVDTLHRFTPSLDDLMPYVHDLHPSTRAAALRLLPMEHEDTWIEIIIAASYDSNEEVQMVVARYLARRIGYLFSPDNRQSQLPDDSRLIRVLQRLSVESHHSVQKYISEEMMKAMSYELTQRYLDALVSDDADARSVALKVLPGMPIHRFRHRMSNLFTRASVHGRTAIIALVTLLDSSWKRSYYRHIIQNGLMDQDIDVRIAAISAAGLHEGTEMRKELMPYMSEPDERIANAAKRAMQCIDDKLTYPSLQAALFAPDSDVRREAVKLLSETNDPRRDALLSLALQNDELCVRIDAVMLARELRSERLYRDLLHIVQHDADQYIRGMAIEALGSYGTYATVPYLITLLREKAHSVRITAMLTLKKVTGQRFDDDLIAWARWWEEEGKRQMLSRIHEGE